MKLSIVHMIIGLVAIVGLSIYFGQARPIFQAEPFQLAQPVTMHGIVPTVPLVAEEPFVEEPFVGSSAPVVSVSNTGYDAMSLKQKSDMIKQVQEMVRSELLAARQLHNLKGELHEEEEELEEEEDHPHRRRPSEFQGRDFYRRSEKSSETCNGNGQGEGEGEGEGEEEYRCPKNPDGSCPPVPDMTNYIRKDQIPCWGCSIDY